MDNIKVSIIIPVYNRPKLLKQAVQSIPKRNDIEVIIVNDGSTDSTTQDIIPNERLKLVNFEQNRGRSIARNTAMNIARGEYYFMLDSDDQIITENFNYFIPLLNGTDLVYYDLIDNDNYQLILNEETKKILVGATKFMRKEFVGRTRYPMGVDFAEDLIFYEKLMKRNPTENFTNIPLLYYNRPRTVEDE